MYLKRYRKPTLIDALRAVREDLGPQALVLSTREVAVRGVGRLIGRREIEVTAAAERSSVPAPRQLDRHAVTLERRRDQAIGEIVARLEAVGLSAAFAREVAASHPVGRRRGAGIAGLRSTLAQALAPLAAADDTYAPVEVFVGPPGVGKTTTIAKIAAQERARRGRRLALLSADGFRPGAIDQLRLYADILGTPFTAARTPDEIAGALRGARRRPLLVDTAGRSPSDEGVGELLRTLSARDGVRTHLVLPATATAKAAERLCERFADTRPARVVLTRLDEADSIGPLVEVLRARRLPVSYFGSGQHVPADLQRATPLALADWLMGETVSSEAVA